MTHLTFHCMIGTLKTHTAWPAKWADLRTWPQQQKKCYKGVLSSASHLLGAPRCSVQWDSSEMTASLPGKKMEQQGCFSAGFCPRWHMHQNLKWGTPSIQREHTHTESYSFLNDRLHIWRLWPCEPANHPSRKRTLQMSWWRLSIVHSEMTGEWLKKGISSNSGSDPSAKYSKSASPGQARRKVPGNRKFRLNLSTATSQQQSDRIERKKDR